MSNQVTSPIQILYRTCMACMLWEDLFYETGSDVAERISRLLPECTTQEIHELVIATAEDAKLRKLPLFLILELAKLKRPNRGIRELTARIIRRPDQMSDMLEILWKDNPNAPIPNGVRRGMADAFRRFSDYSLAKYKGRRSDVSLRDVIRLVRPKPTNETQAALWGRLVNDTLTPPMTWEVELSSSEDKRETWLNLINGNMLGGLAFVRNIRNMLVANVPENLIIDALMKHKCMGDVYPYQFALARRQIDTNRINLHHAISTVMFSSVAELPKLKGRTMVMLDISGSMSTKLSARGDATRCMAAGALAGSLKTICEDSVVFVFNTHAIELSPELNASSIYNSCQAPGGNTLLGSALKDALGTLDEPIDRLVIITDEQSQDKPVFPTGVKTYIVNVGCSQNGIDTSGAEVTVINGFSDHIVRYISRIES